MPLRNKAVLQLSRGKHAASCVHNRDNVESIISLVTSLRIAQARRARVLGSVMAAVALAIFSLNARR